MDTTLTFLMFSGYSKLLWCYLNGKAKLPKKAEFVGRVSDILLHPVKSMKGIHLDEALCTYRGLQYPGKEVFDRNFMLVDEQRKYVNPRMEPKEATIATSVQDDKLVLECSGMQPLHIPIKVAEDKAQVISTKVWGETVEGLDCGDEAAQWMSECLHKPSCRLIYGGDKLLQRELNKQGDRWRMPAKDGDIVTFQDGFPFMLIGQASLDDLNSKQTTETFTMSRFRPNFVVSGCPAFDEDSWSEIWIGDKVKFSFLKPCHRCVLTTIDPETGTKHPKGEPLTTLRKYRLDEPVFGKSPLVGIYLVLDSTIGKNICVGDPVYVLRKQAESF